MPIKWTTWKNGWILRNYNLPKLKQQEIENLNRPITRTEIEAVTKISQQKKPRTDGSTGEFYQKFREELTPILLKLFQEIAGESKLPNSFNDPNIKTRQRCHKKRKPQANITDEHRCKTP